MNSPKFSVPGGARAPRASRTTRSARGWLPTSTALTALLALAGCADMSGIASTAQPRDAASLGLPIVVADAPASAQAESAARGLQVLHEWWRAFGDEQLNALIATALADNPNLRVAATRLARAQAVTEVAQGARLPQVTGQFDATRQLYTQNGLYPAPLAGSVRNSGTLQLSGSWELDFFGKHQAALDAALGSARAAQADVDAARVLLASNVARGWFQLARIEAQLDVARRTLQQREETLKLVRDRFAAGLDTRLEVRQSEGGLPEARQQIEALTEQAQLARNALAALAGQPTLAATLRPKALTDIRFDAPGVQVPAYLPADLLGRRADVEAARWRVQAATRDMDNARAQFYPNVNLVAFAGVSSIGLDRLLESGSSQWGIGPAVRLPIFDAGRLRANLRGKAADLDAAVETYNATVIDAVRDTADQLASLQSIGRQQAEQRQAQAAAESAYDIARQRYQAGLGNYLQVLAAESSVLAQRRQAVDLAARALDTQVALIRAVGGGWQAESPVASR